MAGVCLFWFVKLKEVKERYNVLATVKARRSVRKFKPEHIQDKLIMKLIEAARWAPSGGNIQPWRFIVVQDSQTLRLINMFSPGIHGDPPLVIVACVEEPISSIITSNSVSIMDVAMACENIIILATELGLGTCPVKSFSASAIRKLLKIPPRIKPLLLLSIGFPDDNPIPPPKKSMKEILFREKYGRRF